MSRGRAVKSSVEWSGPSSSITTRMPPSASSLATGAPPAPVPITQASASIVRALPIARPLTIPLMAGRPAP